jgi:uncharacterized protein
MGERKVLELAESRSAVDADSHMTERHDLFSELEENAPERFDTLRKLPSESFRDNWYATFWFETGRGDLRHLVDAVGEDNVMFEAEFPHPNPVEIVSEKVASLRPESQRKIMGENPAKLYRLSPAA